MLLSNIQDLNQTRVVTDVFLGYNASSNVSENEFTTFKNMTTDKYPLLATRERMSRYPIQNEFTTHKINGMAYKEALCYVDHNKLYINDYCVNEMILTDSPKELISMGAYLIVMPDKKYVNTKNLSEVGDIDARFESTSTVNYTMSNVDGEAYGQPILSDTEPEAIHKSYWIDTSGEKHILKQYNENTAMWTSVSTTYVKISSPNIAAAFKQYDAVRITGIPNEATDLKKDFEGKEVILWSVHRDEDGAGAGDYIVIAGFLDMVMSQNTQLVLERKMPVMDFIVECNNRLWGCRYGTDNDGNVVNEIYASKLGDFKNWKCFMGLSTDSYAASCGTDGMWTGAVLHAGYPVFFKENYLHKVFGSMPSNFQISSTPCRGVAKGCGKSVAIVNEAVMYKSTNGICVYDGSLPVEVSGKLGSATYNSASVDDYLRNGAVAGGFNGKYYISMGNGNSWTNFVYDLNKNIWSTINGNRIMEFCNCGNELLYVDYYRSVIVSTNSRIRDDYEQNLISSVVTGPLGKSLVDRKYISKMLIKLKTLTEGSIRFSIKYDDETKWNVVSILNTTGENTYPIYIKSRRCDRFYLKIEANCEYEIHNIVKTIEQGSDVL